MRQPSLTSRQHLDILFAYNAYLRLIMKLGEIYPFLY